MTALQKMLQEREQYYLDMLEALPVAIYTTDAIGKSPITIRPLRILPDAALSSAATSGASPGGCSGRTGRPCRTPSAPWL
jgi:hypothetical protein